MWKRVLIATRTPATRRSSRSIPEHARRTISRKPIHESDPFLIGASIDAAFIVNNIGGLSLPPLFDYVGGIRKICE